MRREIESRHDRQETGGGKDGVEVPVLSESPIPQHHDEPHHGKNPEKLEPCRDVPGHGEEGLHHLGVEVPAEFARELEGPEPDQRELSDGRVISERHEDRDQRARAEPQRLQQEARWPARLEREVVDRQQNHGEGREEEPRLFTQERKPEAESAHEEERRMVALPRVQEHIQAGEREERHEEGGVGGEAQNGRTQCHHAEHERADATRRAAVRLAQREEDEPHDGGVHEQ